MPTYFFDLCDTTSGRRVMPSVIIFAVNDLEAIAKAAEHGPSNIYRSVLRDGDRIVAEWPSGKSDD
jgi:hypothetical protein